MREQGATVTDMNAGYPADCPSLPAYLLITSGSTHGICDNADPEAHMLDGPSIFSSISDAGRQWRVFAESMDTPCRRSDTSDDRYLVRHTAAPYYTSELDRCQRWQVPLGTPDAGALSEAIDAGLPAFSLVVPDRCNDMHGGAPCTGERVAVGDLWLQEWLPRLLAGPDYASGSLLVVITWDEAHSRQGNQIPTLVLHPSLAGTEITEPRDHCSTLRTVTDRLGLDPLGCAADVTPLVPPG
ncbi:alkaline phosphatase family protein [Ornithinimicrobium sp. LYQ103]|uniref:alkaline phosphatase family protein n=1 Tax=Ornithinimicrobium sp. LYQ103 TaxID=3378796 RepID=UPI0038621242